MNNLYIIFLITISKFNKSFYDTNIFFIALHKFIYLYIYKYFVGFLFLNYKFYL